MGCHVAAEFKERVGRTIIHRRGAQGVTMMFIADLSLNIHQNETFSRSRNADFLYELDPSLQDPHGFNATGDFLGYWLLGDPQQLIAMPFEIQ